MKQAVDEFFRSERPVIRAGPFAGVTYVRTAAGSQLLPKLLGTYEQELQELIENAVRRNYDTVIDVGCAEGYYAVGLARRLPGAAILAYDTDPAARRLCAALARANDVDSRVKVRGECTAATLRREVHGRVLVISDCEGYEATLLDPINVPGLATCDLLVELHEHVAGGVTRLLSERFTRSHHRLLVGVRERSATDVVDPPEFSSTWLSAAVQEFRPADQQWAYFTALGST